MRALVLIFFLTGCGGLAWNTTVADAPSSRWAMLASLVPGQTTEKRFVAQWGNPTQKIREGAQVPYVYRNMSNPAGYPAPQFGDSSRFVVVTFQYGLAIGGYSSDSQRCRGTFPPRPPGPNFDNPTTVHPVNCSGLPNPPRPGNGVQTASGGPMDATGIGLGSRPGVPLDSYDPDGKYK